MKTKLNITLLAAAALLTLNVSATAQTPPPPPAGPQSIDGMILQLIANDFVINGAAVDRICGGMDDDQLHGNDGDDTLHGNDGDDTLHGNDGDDTLHSPQAGNATTGASGLALFVGPSICRGLISDPLGLVGPVINPGIESDPFGITGDGGGDLVGQWLGFTGDPMEEDAVLQVLTGLWGDGGVDSLTGPVKP